MKNKILVVYKSKTGFTERFAQWIGEELPAELVPYKQRKSVCLDEYDTVIFGGGFHAGMIGGVKWLKEKLPQLKDKSVVVFATGATPSNAPDVKKAIDQNFTDEEREKIKIFYMQSGLCYEKMGTADKLMMAVFRNMVKKTEGENSETYKMIQQSYDYSSKDSIRPLVEYCQNI